MSYSRILVALDRSAQGETVLKQAIALAKPNQAQLLLFHTLIFDGRNLEAYSGIYLGVFNSDFLEGESVVLGFTLQVGELFRVC